MGLIQLLPAEVYSCGNWLEELDERCGVWPLSGNIEVPIVNYPDGPEKRVWVQLA